MSSSNYKTIHLPGSKYWANRAIVLAALAEGQTVLNNIPCNDDINHVLQAVQQLGAQLKHDNSHLVIDGCAGCVTSKEPLFLAGNGTATRLLTAVAATAQQSMTISANQQMQQRPMTDLLAALSVLGANIEQADFPINITGPLQGGEVNLAGNVSSQFLSGLLMAAPLAKKSVTIHLKTPLVSQSYVKLTLDLMERFGVTVVNDNWQHFMIEPQGYHACDIQLPPDPATASYFLAAAVIKKQNMLIADLIIPRDAFSDAGYLHLFTELGCELIQQTDGLLIKTTQQHSKPIQADFSLWPDVVPTFAVLAACIEGESQLKNIAHLRFKESDRVSALINELTKIGISARYEKGDLILYGGKLKPAVIDSYHDHRIAMSFGLLQSIETNIQILQPESVNKSYPEFWQQLSNFALT